MSHSMITYENAVIKDALRLSILFQQVYIHNYALEGITDEFTNFISRRFSPDNIRTTILNHPDSLIVACYKGNPVGIAELAYHNSCPIGNKEGAELNKLYVLDRFCGRSVGKQLLMMAEKNAMRKGFTGLWLEVWQENPRAIQFYEREHYQTLGRVDCIMETNTYQNMVMWKALTAGQSIGWNNGNA